MKRVEFSLLLVLTAIWGCWPCVMKAESYHDCEGNLVVHRCLHNMEEQMVQYFQMDKGWELLYPTYPEEGVICRMPRLDLNINTPGFEINVGYHVEVDGYPMHFAVLSEDPAEVAFVNTIYDWGSDVLQFTNYGVLLIPDEVEIGGKQYSVAEMGRGSIWSPHKLVRVKLPDSLETINSDAIYLEELCDPVVLDLGKSVRYIRPYGMRRLNLKEPLTLPGSLREIGDFGLMCYTPQTVNIETGVRRFGKGIFSNSANLEEIILPTSMRVMGEDCFRNCPSLRRIELPRWCNLSDGCFNDCPEIKEVICYSNAPMEFGEGDLEASEGKVNPSCFNAVDFNNCVLYVPKYRKQFYEQQKGWRLFKNIVELNEDGSYSNDAEVISIESQALEGVTRYFLYDGTEVGNPDNLAVGTPYLEVVGSVTQRKIKN